MHRIIYRFTGIPGILIYNFIIDITTDRISLYLQVLRFLRKFSSRNAWRARLKTSTPNFTFRCLMLIRLGKLLARLQGSLHCRLTNYVSNLEGHTGSIDPCGIRNSVCHLPNIKYSYPNLYNVFRETWYNNTITQCQFESVQWTENCILRKENSISKSDKRIFSVALIIANRCQILEKCNFDNLWNF